MLGGIEHEFPVAGRAQPGPWHRGGNPDRSIHGFLAVGKIERMQLKDRRTLLECLRHLVYYAGLRIDYARAEDSDLRIDVRECARVAGEHRGWYGRTQIHVPE